MNEKQQQQSRQRNSAAVARAGLYQSLEPAQRPAESVDAAESVDGAWKQKQETCE